MSSKKQVQAKTHLKKKIADRKDKQETKVARKLLSEGKVKKQSKYDPKSADFRNAKSTVSLNQETRLTTANPSIVYEVPLDPKVIYGPAIAAVSYALQRGWQPTTPNSAYPYWAFCYLCQQLLNYATTGKISTMDIPYWLAYIGQSLIEKRVPFGSGFVTYKFTVDTSSIPSTFPVVVPMGAFTPNNLARHWTIGAIDDSGEGSESINGFRKILTGGFTYDADDGQKAWTSLIQFLANVFPPSDPRHQMHKLIPSNLELVTTHDPSAYSLVKPQPGGGYAGAGSWFGTNELEVPILTPLLARFKTTQGALGYDQVRFPKHVVQTSLDSIATAGAYLHLLDKPSLRTKHAIIPKIVDFYQCCEVVFLWMREIAKLRLEDVTNIAANIKPGSGTAQTTIPLTMQEVMLIIRATLMNLFKDTQFMVQGSFETPMLSNAQDGYTSLIAGAGQGAYAAETVPKFPIILVENWRSLTYRKNYPDKIYDEVTRKWKLDRRHPQLIVPVLSASNKSNFVPEDYDVYYHDPDGVLRGYPLFTDPKTAFSPEATPLVGTPQVKDRRSKEIKVGAEVPISMIDGSTADGFLAVNDPRPLNDLFDVWNAWVELHANYSVPLTTLGSDGGINSLEVISMTEHWAEQNSSIQGVETKPLRLRKLERETFDKGPFFNRGARIVSSSYCPDSATWETVQQFFIKPVNIDETVSATDPRTFCRYQRIQAASNEPHTIVKVESNVAPNLAQKHYELAMLNSRQKDQLPTELLDFIKQQAALGRGGILSSLAASFLGNDTAKQIASYLPF